MCGILGFSQKRPLTLGDIERGLRYLTFLEHRGPDGQGHEVFTDQGVFIGHRRLAILDLSNNASQPMTRNGLTVAHNGEIYNFIEIRKNLEAKGLVFSTDSDTEVLVKAWHQSGVDCLNSFDGMFAFALFDGRNTNLVTDPFGEKPLYVCENEDGVYYASEPEPLVRMLGLEFNPSESELAAFLTLGFIPPPDTGFRNLRLLQPGSHVVISDGKIKRISRYWTPDVPTVWKSKPLAAKDADIDAVADALIESIRVRLRSDVQMATFLSSGIDSALVAAITSKELNVDIPAITVGFPGTNVPDESADAKAISNHLGLEHQILYSDGLGAIGNQDDIEMMTSIYGAAIDTPTVIPALAMSKTARKSATVALSGVGGDELFYGYNRYQLFYKNQTLFSLKDPLRSMASFLLRITGRKTGSELLKRSDRWTYANFKNVGVLDILDRVPNMRDWGEDYFKRFCSPHYIASRHLDLTEILPGSFIPAIERSSMRVGLEVRTPFLSRKLLAVVNDLDPRSLVGFGQKSIARRLLGRYLLEELIIRGKRGFNSPIDPIVRSAKSIPQISGIDEDVMKLVMDRRFIGRGRDLFVRFLLIERLKTKNKTSLSEETPYQLG